MIERNEDDENLSRFLAEVEREKQARAAIDQKARESLKATVKGLLKKHGIELPTSSPSDKDQTPGN